MSIIQKFYCNFIFDFIFQLKIKEEREAKRATMDGRHEFILSTVSERLGMSLEDAEDFMLDNNQVLEVVVCVW